MQFGTSSETNIYTHICVHVPNALSRMRFYMCYMLYKSGTWNAAVKLCGCPLGGGLKHNLPEELIHDFLENKSLKGSSHCVQRGPER